MDCRYCTLVARNSHINVRHGCL